MKVTYVTVEDINSGLFETQVANLIKTMLSGSDKSLSIQLIVINYPWRFFSHQKKLRDLFKQSEGLSWKITYLPLLPPLKYMMSSKTYLNLLRGWVSLILRLSISSSSSIIHCRSYIATYAATFVTNKPIIFDMRSLWVLENISAKNLIQGSSICEEWFQIERHCLNKSSVSLCVSNWMCEYVKDKYNISSYQLVPIGVDIERFRFNSEERLKKRRLLSWENQCILVYSGSLGLSGINQSALVDFLKEVKAKNRKTKVLFLTQSPPEEIISLCEEAKINKDEYIVIHNGFQDIRSWLSAADIGIHALPMQLDSRSRLGTKIVEYFANGLPVMVNSHVGAAAEIIRDNHLGIVIDSSEDHLVDFINMDFADYRKIYSARSSKYAEEVFCFKKISNTYKKIYEKVEAYG